MRTLLVFEQSIELSLQDEDTDVARSVQKGVLYNTDIISLILNWK